MKVAATHRLSTSFGNVASRCSVTQNNSDSSVIFVRHSCGNVTASTHGTVTSSSCRCMVISETLDCR